MNEFRHTVEDALSLETPQVAAEAVPPTPAAAFDLEALEEFRRVHARHTLMARVALLTLIFGMLGANIWLTQRSFETLMVNLDVSRSDSQVVMDQQSASIEIQSARLAAIEARLAAMEANAAPVAALASAR